MRQLYEGPVVPKVNDAKTFDRFPGLWERTAVDNLVPETKYDVLPYDNYCPSVKTEVNRRVCKKCHIYHPSIACLKRHQKVCTRGEENEESDDIRQGGDDEVETMDRDDDISSGQVDDVAPVLNIFDMLQNSAFMDDDESNDDV